MASEGPHSSRRELTADHLEVLLQRLAPDPSEAADRYNRLCTRLRNYFRWERCTDPDRLADEVIDRVARRASEGQEFVNVQAYVLGVARNVASEARERHVRQARALGEMARKPPAEPTDDAALTCLDQCLVHMSADQREQVLTYYCKDSSARIAERKRLASLLGVRPVALRNRMLRVRARLEACVTTCLTARDTSVSPATKKGEADAPGGPAAPGRPDMSGGPS
jgi:DNA-directed RNA polymerase specialized sigma24 family protein